MVTAFGNKPSINVMQLIFNGVFDRFPTLQIYFAETQIGWLPMWLQEVDDSFRRRKWTNELYGLPKLERTPSEYIRDHFMWGFLNDPFGVRQRHEIGLHKIMWASDFPHSKTDWPHSQETINSSFRGVPDDERYEMLAGNAIKFFHLEDA
jgi:predicted TIM-barrel fold metal-dependent hydrolase